MNIEHIIFDWDGTLWDFNKNSKSALKDTFEKYNLSDYFNGFNQFSEIYHFHNEKLWSLYRKGEISKQKLMVKRFEETFKEKNINDSALAQEFGKNYMEGTTVKTELFPNAKPVIRELCEKYKLHIITNGFNELQYLKINNSGLSECFTEIITSEDAGALKPSPKIFKFALEKTGAKKENSILIGDDLEADIKGAIDFGIKSVFFNPKEKTHNLKPDFEIIDLNEIKEILNV